MKKSATVIHHGGGFFLAINGDLNRREVVIKGFTKGLSKVKQYYKMLTHTYSSYEYEPEALQCPFDLNDREDLTIADIWDPNINTIDPDTGEFIETPENERVFTEEDILQIDNTINQVKQQNKSLLNIMETTKRSQASQKGWETRKANMQKQIELEKQALLTAKKEETKRKRAETIAFNKLWDEAIQYNLDYDKAIEEEQARESQEIKQRILDALNDKGLEKQIMQAEDNYNKQVKDEAPAPEASQINNNPVNSNQMKTENQAQSAQQPTPKPLGRRARRSFAKITEVGVVLITDTIIGGSILGSDLLGLVAEAGAWTQAAAIKPLGLHPDATRQELKERAIKRAEDRSAFVISLPVQAVALPRRIMKGIQMKNDNNIVDVNNAEIVQ
jgi:hypothetical protein